MGLSFYNAIVECYFLWNIVNIDVENNRTGVFAHLKVE